MVIDLDRDNIRANPKVLLAIEILITSKKWKLDSLSLDSNKYLETSIIRYYKVYKTSSNSTT